MGTLAVLQNSVAIHLLFIVTTHPGLGMAEVTRKTRHNYSSVVLALKELRGAGLLTFQMKGRERLCFPTKAGLRAAVHATRLIELVSNGSIPNGWRNHRG